MRIRAAVEECLINDATTFHANRAASARAFVHSLNILIKYARMYGPDHKRTEAQFETAWNELQNGLPTAGEGGFLLGVSDNKLLLDGVPLEAGQTERSFGQLLSTAGLASLHFSKDVTIEDFARLVRAFTVAGSKAQDVTKQIKEALNSESKNSTIKINEVKFVAADPLTGDISVAAQIAAQTLGPEFKQWLNDPQKLLQLIAAAEGANASGGGQGSGGQGGASVPFGSVPNVPGHWVAGAAPSTGDGSGTATAPAWEGAVVPLQEAEVVQAIRLLTRFGQVQEDPNASPEVLQKELTETDPNTRLNLQQLLGSLAAKATTEQQDTPLLMKAAEHMAIRFALERYSKGEVKVNAVHQMMEHMSRQMDSLRQILKLQEDKMNKAGILVESHADILDRMFWAEVPESGKKTVLMSNEAPCVPPRNLRQFVEVLLDRDDKQASAEILDNYSGCLGTKDAEARRKTAIGLSQLADLYSRCRALVVPGEEDFGITMVEAFASGKPVIAFARGGAMEIVENGRGVLFPEQTEDSLGDALESFDRIESLMDPEESIRCARKYSEAAFDRRFLAALREMWRRSSQRSTPKLTSGPFVMQPIQPGAGLAQLAAGD